jgi:hypothetical protein
MRSQTHHKSINQNGYQKSTEMDELKAKVAQVESSKPAFEALLKRVFGA